MRALVIDSRPSGLGAALPALENSGFSVDVARSVSQAVAMARLAGYALILLDLALADGEALATARRIRTLGGDRREVPIVALIDRVDTDVLAACVVAGINEVVAKPADRALLENVIRRWCGHPRQPKPAAEAPDPDNIDGQIFGRLRRAMTTRTRRHLAERFVAEAESRLDALRDAAAQGEHRRVRAEAHALKSSAALFGLIRVHGLAEEIERQATGERDATAAVETLAAAAPAACAALRAAVG